jgi:hypothetical protein
MPRKLLSDDQRLALQPLRISPLVKRRLDALSFEEKKRVRAEMRKAVEFVINYMTHSGLQSDFQPGQEVSQKDNFIVDAV